MRWSVRSEMGGEAEGIWRLRLMLTDASSPLNWNENMVLIKLILDVEWKIGYRSYSLGDGSMEDLRVE